MEEQIEAFEDKSVKHRPSREENLDVSHAQLESEGGDEKK